ncbi:MAG: alpha/beta fold hydrolase [Bacteroidota bacterium]
MWTPPDLPPYVPPLGLSSGHLQTVVPALFRTVEGITYHRTRLELDDGDFLDLDRQPAAFSRLGAEAERGRTEAEQGRTEADGPTSDRAVLISHGLEGSSQRAYVRGMVRGFARRGWDAIAWNHRGCSGEPNRLLRAYHSGATEDLAAVVAWARGERYRQIGLVGFSLGGNVTLKYVGDEGEALAPEIVGAVGISVPVDLAGSAEVMEAWDRRLYMARFLRTLAAKAEDKARRFPDAPDASTVRQMTTFAEFDGQFTAPVHGFASAEDYWARCSSLPVLPRIAIPTLLANARNDPFLSPSCFPEAENPMVTLAAPASGGHVGFVGIPLGGELWSETVAAVWLEGASAYASSSASVAAPPSTA